MPLSDNIDPVACQISAQEVSILDFELLKQSFMLNNNFTGFTNNALIHRGIRELNLRHNKLVFVEVIITFFIKTVPDIFAELFRFLRFGHGIEHFKSPVEQT